MSNMRTTHPSPAVRPALRLTLAAFLVIAFASPIDLESCGPFIPYAVFVRPGKPDNLKAFYQGQLGVLQPTYWRRYLALSYRILSGIPLSADQVASLADETNTRRTPVRQEQLAE